MNDYNRDTFWTSTDEITGNKRYYIKLNESLIEVNKEVYYIMFNSYRKELYFNKRQMEHKDVSLDATEHSAGLYAFLAGSNLNDEITYSGLIQAIYEQLSNLDEVDKCIIELSLFQEMSEREIGRILNMPQKTVHNHKVKSIRKIKNFLKKWLK